MTIIIPEMDQSIKNCLVWWYTPFIPVLGKQRQEDICDFEASQFTQWIPVQPGLCREKPCLKEKRKKEKVQTAATNVLFIVPLKAVKNNFYTFKWLEVYKNLIEYNHTSVINVQALKSLSSTFLLRTQLCSQKLLHKDNSSCHHEVLLAWAVTKQGWKSSIWCEKIITRSKVNSHMLNRTTALQTLTSQCSLASGFLYFNHYLLCRTIPILHVNTIEIPDYERGKNVYFLLS